MAAVALSAVVFNVTVSAAQTQPSAAQRGGRAPRTTSTYCAPPSTQALNPAGGLLIGPSCGGFVGLFYYGSNNAPTSPSSYNQVTTSVNMPTSAAAVGGLPSIPGTIPQAYFEVVGLSSSPSLQYRPPSSDKSLIESTNIVKGAKYEIVGYDYVPSGSNAGFNVIYQSNIYTAKYANLLSVSSPLSGLTLPQLTHAYFVLLNASALVPVGRITEYALDWDSWPADITSGPDGALWFTESMIRPAPFGYAIGRITTSGAITITEYAIPSGNAGDCIAAGPDGALWFTEFGGIGRITTSGAVTEYTTFGYPIGIAAGPDGALWFTEWNNIGRITAGGAITEYAIPTQNSAAVSIAAGPDGALWFTERDANRIGRITTGGAVTEYVIPTQSSAAVSIAAGPDGALWFTEFGGIGRITTSGAITEFAVPTASGRVGEIAAGPDGALWFTEFGNNIGRITTSGVITEYAMPPIADNEPYGNPYGIAAGPDGALWFTIQPGGKIGRITTGLTPDARKRVPSLRLPPLPKQTLHPIEAKH